MESDDFKLMITCEHASNALPASAKALGMTAEILDTHRGYDIGALQVYKALVKEFKPDFYCSGKYSRLFIDLNRSLKNNKTATPEAKAYYKKYREPVEEFAISHVKAGEQVLHLAIHSFTPELNGIVRNADIGILYDPRIPLEHAFADIIIEEIHSKSPELKVRKNYPYQGKTDGLCTSIRKNVHDFKNHKFANYAGFEIEINQKLFG